MKNLSHVISFLLFLGILVAFGLTTLILPKAEKSEVENRTLAAPPVFSAERILERRFMKDSETYLADHFLWRTQWISLKTHFGLLLGNKEANNVFITKHRLMEHPTPPDNELVKQSGEAISTFAAKSGIPTFLLIAPTSTEVYRDRLPANAPAFDQKELIRTVYQQVQLSPSANVTPIDVSGALIANRENNQEIYFKTDHHWTSQGAYEAYAVAAKKMGFTSIPIENFNVEHASDEFLGTLYSKVVYNSISPDSIDLYTNPSGSSVTTVEVQDENGIKAYPDYFFREYLTQKDKYAVYCGDNKPRFTVKTDAPSDKKLLIIKDSYANVAMQFFSQHYSEVTMVDMRFINIPLGEFVNINDYDQVLFLYNAATFAGDANIKKVARAIA